MPRNDTNVRNELRNIQTLLLRSVSGYWILLQYAMQEIVKKKTVEMEFECKEGFNRIITNIRRKNVQASHSEI